MSPFSSPSETVYAFTTEHHDPQSGLTKQYRLLYWPTDQAVELYDLKLKKNFLKRTVYPQLQLQHLFIGSTVNIYARQYKVLAYGDAVTQQLLAQQKQHHLAVIKAEGVPYIGAILDVICSVQPALVLSRITMLQLNDQDAKKWLSVMATPAPTAETSTLPSTLTYEDLSGKKVILIEVIGTGMVNQLSKLGSMSSQVDAQLLSTVYVYDDVRLAAPVLSPYFNIANTSIYQSPATAITIAILKPHILQQGLVGKVVDDIQHEGQYIITAMSSIQFDRKSAEEFLEVYKGVVPEYHHMVEHYISGTSVMLELAHNEYSKSQPEIVQRFRQFCGPVDSEIAKHLRPQSLRAKYGENKVMNALHATDLAEDAPLEAEFFNLLKAGSY